MAIKFRNYTSQAGITEDYHKVRAFLIKRGYSEFTYARWDWMIKHINLDQSALDKIGLWEENNEIVGIAIFDTGLGTGYCLTKPEYNALKEDMLNYAEAHLSKAGQFNIVISDLDILFQDIAQKSGYIATRDREYDAIFYLDKADITYDLPEGFHVTSMDTTYDLDQYMRVLWKGFNHELNGEGPYVFEEEYETFAADQMRCTNVDLNLKIAVVSPEGNFVSYCGMWYDVNTDFAVIEPLATDPEYRKLGLGKAAVLEGVKRVKAMGAKKVLVGSSQHFYYSIGMRPFATATLWKNSVRVKGKNYDHQ